MKTTYSLTLTGAALLTAACATTVASDGRGISAEDYYDMVQISSPQLSPNGEHVVFAKRSMQDDKRGWDSNLWVVGADGADLRQFTYANSDSGAKWSPDGDYLLFSGSRNGDSGLYRIRLRGGEAQPFLQLEQGSVSDFHWLPGNQQMLLTISLKTDVSDPMEKAEDDDDTADVWEARHAVYKRQGGYLEHDSERSLWLYNPEDGELTALTHGDGYDANEVQLSPDGSRVLFAANRHEDALEGAYSQSLFVIDLQGNEMTLPTDEGRASQARWLDDSRIVYLHTPEAYADTSLKVMDLNSERSEVLVETMDLGPQGIEVLNGALYFVADERGSRTLQRFDLDSRELTQLDGEGYSLGQAHMTEHGFVATREHEAMMPELYMHRWNDNGDVDGHTRLTSFSHDLRSELSFNRYQRFQVTGESGHQTDGFFLEPLNRQPGQSYPLILNIKGGPGGMWGHQFMQEMQLMAARGYAVVFVNYRGSSGYGQDFSDQVREDYGGADFEDNMLAVDYVLDNYDWIDADRLFVTGGSHGGFLTNWITTQTDRFKAAVTQRSVSNWISEAGTQAFPPESMRVEFGGTIWENYDYYWDRSPLKYADRVTTPTLIIHSTDDHITPIGQGEEWFYALKANDVETEMAVFRGEGHGLSRAGRPINLVDRLNRIIDWFDRYND
ncbi:MAG: S9 family peptidase [Idiomarina sp.]|nr:S9 family peptidase [Idiomarina sp.]